MKDDLGLFLSYYNEVRKRLTVKKRAYNRKLKKDSNPVIRVFREDLADLNDGGKMLRGMLVTLGYRLAGGREEEAADSLALAFEVFQTAILVHDDIIDRAGLRRGKITIHRRYVHRLDVRGTKMISGDSTKEHVADAAALCTGDFGICAANLKIAEDYAGHPNLAALISAFDGIVLDTIRGELLDVVLPYELQDSSFSEDERKKTLEQSVRDI